MYCEWAGRAAWGQLAIHAWAQRMVAAMLARWWGLAARDRQSIAQGEANVRVWRRDGWRQWRAGCTVVQVAAAAQGEGSSYQRTRVCSDTLACWRRVAALRAAQVRAWRQGRRLWQRGQLEAALCRWLDASAHAAHSWALLLLHQRRGEHWRCMRAWRRWRLEGECRRTLPTLGARGVAHWVHQQEGR